MVCWILGEQISELQVTRKRVLNKSITSSYVNWRFSVLYFSRALSNMVLTISVSEIMKYIFIVFKLESLCQATQPLLEQWCTVYRLIKMGRQLLLYLASSVLFSSISRFMFLTIKCLREVKMSSLVSFRTPAAHRLEAGGEVW